MFVLGLRVDIVVHLCRVFFECLKSSDEILVVLSSRFREVRDMYLFNEMQVDLLMSCVNLLIMNC